SPLSHPAMNTIVFIALLGTAAAANQQLNRSKRQFIEVDSGAFAHQPVMYRYSAAAAPYFTGVAAPTLVAAAPRPTVYIQRRPVYQRIVEPVQYVPVRRYFRPTVIVDRPRILTPVVHHSPLLVELEKRRRMMAKH
ncbi:hypothetical protein PMAYCL1PPCAC_30896, partial [Pristionchus mayeri]